MGLSYNDLSGNIPISVEKLDLRRFNVSVNRLEGKVPTGGCFLSITSQSFLQDSALCGPTRWHLPPCQTKESNLNHIRSLIKYSLPSIAAFILIAAAIIFLCLRWEKGVIQSLKRFGNHWPHDWRKVSYPKLRKATDSFDEGNLIGIGSFGSVKRRTILDGTNIGVKVFHWQPEGLSKNFDVECAL